MKIFDHKCYLNLSVKQHQCPLFSFIGNKRTKEIKEKGRINYWFKGANKKAKG